MDNNPFLVPFKTPFGTLPFDNIEVAHFLPALEIGIKQAQHEIEAITQNAEAPSFSNTVEALEKSGALLGTVSECLFNLYSAETSDALQEAARKASPKLTQYANDVLLNTSLFERVAKVWEQRDAYQLNDEQRMLLRKTYFGFLRNGAQLPDDKKEILREIDQELAQLSLTFAEHVLADTHNFILHLESEHDLDGLPEAVKEAAADEAQSRDLAGWVFTLDMPSYLPFMTYSKQRSLREKMYRAAASKGFRDNENNNEDIVKKIADLRQKRADLLGFASHADYVLQERMAETPEKVLAFLEEMRLAAKPFAEKERETIVAYAKTNEQLQDVQRWDTTYLVEKMKKERFEIDDELLKPYFPLDATITGVFEVATRLFGLQFVARQDIPTYHPDVKTYDVQRKDGTHLSVLYADFFPRKSKRNGAWMTSYRNQKIRNGEDIRPHISIVCNFTKPTGTKPSLLTFQEVTTLFHEFGHALHGMLAQGTYGSLSGTNVYWDFVELPSQLLENWCYEKACLDLFAKHYQTGEKISEALITKLRESATFMEGMATMRQVGLATLDMAWHTGKHREGTRVADFENAQLAPTDLWPAVPETAISTAFSHIFQGGYAAGYYSYKWAEVLDADAFERFQEEGIFNEQVASDLQTLLAAGGSQHPMALYKAFRGQEPDPKALLRRAGLTSN